MVVSAGGPVTVLAIDTKYGLNIAAVGNVIKYAHVTHIRTHTAPHAFSKYSTSQHPPVAHHMHIAYPTPFAHHILQVKHTIIL